MAYLGEEIKKLGFGLMRLPTIGDEIDVEQTKQMVDLFMTKGFTYFDTAYGYANGKSEMAIKEALVDRYPRESFQLATKLPAWAGAQTEQEAHDMLWTSLKRTGAGYFDFYLLHNIGDNRKESFDKFHIWEFLAEQRERGVIKHLGFSFHDKADVLDALLKEHPEMEFVQLQINYADWEDGNVQSRKCYEVARKHNKPVIIMEPVKGGFLTALPESVSSVLQNAAPEKSLASWAIRFAASLPGLVTVLSGMSTLEQMQDNLATMETFQPLTAEESAVIQKAQEAIAALPQIPCTACEYCIKGCPKNIAIPQIFAALNKNSMYGQFKAAKMGYGFETKGKGRASDCIECRQCEAVCPQHIHIVDELKKAVELFEKD